MPSHKPTYGNFFEFKKDDIFHNRIKAHPKIDFYIYTGSVYYNNENQSKEIPGTPNGHINLYELNVNRDAHASGLDNQLITPFVTKQGSFSNFKTISTSDFNLDFALGDKVEGSYPMTAGISVERYDNVMTAAKQNRLYALRNTLDFYTTLSPHYAYSSDLGNKELQYLNLISIPSIFYGSSIKKGSVSLKYYVTGGLIAEATDSKKDGRLIQTSTGETIGVALYNEGFLYITSSAGLSTHKEAYKVSDSTAYSASWNYFASTSSYSSISSSYSISFRGTNYIETITMFAHAKERQLNHSNNPTFVSGAIAAVTAPDIYHEDSQALIKNIVSSSYKNHEATFKPVTYISKVGIYDKDKNLIAIAGLANPVKKLEDRSYTFKLKLDI
jgi:hypothetical protein